MSTSSSASGQRGAASPPLEPPTLRELLDLCGEVLHIPPPGPESDFFTLGGDSLTASALTVEIEARWGRELAVSAVFVAPDLAAMHQAIVETAPLH